MHHKSKTLNIVFDRLSLNETADYLCMLKSGCFRSGLELLKVRRNQVGFITDPHNPKTPIMKITLLETKKDRHTPTVADWFRD